MARKEAGTTLDEILTQIVARLIDQITAATAATCYLSLDPDSLPAGNPGGTFFVVSPAIAGNFDGGMFDGGGQNQTTVVWPIVVTVWNTSILDESGHDTQFITNATLGVVVNGTLVLKALAGHDLQDTEVTPNEILAQPIFPSDAAIDRREPSKGKGFMQFGFNVTFDWDLS